MVSFAFAAKNMGPALVYDSEQTRLPQTFQFGLGYETPLREDRLTPRSITISRPAEKIILAVGQEFWVKRTIAIRAGYQFAKRGIGDTRDSLWT